MSGRASKSHSARPGPRWWSSCDDLRQFRPLTSQFLRPRFHCTSRSRLLRPRGPQRQAASRTRDLRPAISKSTPIGTRISQLNCFLKQNSHIIGNFTGDNFTLPRWCMASALGLQFPEPCCKQYQCGPASLRAIPIRVPRRSINGAIFNQLESLGVMETAVRSRPTRALGPDSGACSDRGELRSLVSRRVESTYRHHMSPRKQPAYLVQTLGVSP